MICLDRCQCRMERGWVVGFSSKDGRWSNYTHSHRHLLPEIDLSSTKIKRKESLLPFKFIDKFLNSGVSIVPRDQLISDITDRRNTNPFPRMLCPLEQHPFYFVR